MSTKLVEVDPNPAEPRMVIWSTLRCLELQIDQHEELHNSTGVVSWGLLKQMLRLAKRHACEEGGAVIAAERETDQWRTRADEANAKLLETQQELQRLRAFVQLARGITPSVSFAEVEMLRAALAELDAGTIQPAPCPELERLRERLDHLERFARVVTDAHSSATPTNCMSILRSAMAHLDFEPAPMAEPLDPDTRRAEHERATPQQ